MTNEELWEDLREQLDDLQEQLGQPIHENDLQILLRRAFDSADGGGEVDLFAAHNELVQSGVPPDDEDFDEPYFDDMFEDGIEQLETQLGRELFDKEREELYEKTSPYEVDPVATFERLHNGQDPYGGADDKTRVARGVAIADQVFERQEAGEPLTDPAESDDGEDGD